MPFIFLHHWFLIVQDVLLSSVHLTILWAWDGLYIPLSGTLIRAFSGSLFILWAKFCSLLIQYLWLNSVPVAGDVWTVVLVNQEQNWVFDEASKSIFEQLRERGILFSGKLFDLEWRLIITSGSWLMCGRVEQNAQENQVFLPKFSTCSRRETLVQYLVLGV